MKKIYADNSATSFPKAPGVSKAMADFIDNVGCNVNRGGYESSYNTALEILETRSLVGEMFHCNNPKNVIFTPSVTYSLNMLIRGLLGQGDHLIVTSMEHNAVMRPITEMTKAGVKFDRALCGEDGSLSPKTIEGLINPNTKAVIMTHASNVCGTVLPVEEVSEICRRRGVALIVDAAQTAGVLDIDIKNIDALAFTGHKGLLGPQGVGGFILNNGIEEKISPLIVGGTGSASHEEIQPEYLPDKFESGTMNIPAILGLKTAVEYINSVGKKNILAKEMHLTEMFLEGVRQLPGVKLVGKSGLEGRLAVISLDFTHRDNAEISTLLDSRYGIMTRCGLHCAPSAHKTLNTYPAGTVRFSFGHFNSREDVSQILEAIKEILKDKE